MTPTSTAETAPRRRATSPATWLRRTARAGRARLGSLCALATVDLLAGGRKDPPGSAELVDTLARRLAGLPVGDEVVERVTAVGDFELAVLALRRAEQGGAHAVSGDRLSVRDEWRPEGVAVAVAA